MNIRKFEAVSFQEALNRVKSELGPDALILGTEEKKRGWFQKPIVEITAAFEPPADSDWDDSTLEQVFPHRRKPVSESTSSEEARPSKVNTVTVASERRRPQSGVLSTSDTENALLNIGLQPETAREFARQIVFDYPKKDRDNSVFAEKVKAKLLSSGMKTLSVDIFQTRRTWAAVGTPGSGKTTLLVKLALALKGATHSVVLSTQDRRKITGRYELEAYAKLIEVPFKAEKADKKGRPVFLTDTPSLNLEHDALYKEVEKACRDASTVLVLDASQRLPELLRTVESFEGLAPVALAFTKLDLVSQAGVIYDVLKQTRLPLLGLSVSQSFSNAFRFFEGPSLARYIIRRPTESQKRQAIIEAAASVSK